jgi:hypothetical protein
VGADELLCKHCGARFTVVDGIAMLINAASSVVDVNEVVNAAHVASRPKGILAILERVLPDPSINLVGEANFAKLLGLVESAGEPALTLVVGGAVVGRGMDRVVAHPLVELVETDIYVGPRTTLVCDAHDLPFADESFDAVIIQAVLEHVADPYRCVQEVHRVLKPRGFVYAETPFMQQVHEGRFDFTRFTPLGHRRLFRRFDEISSGIVAGPATALAWSYKYFCASFFRSRTLSMAASAVARLTGSWVKYFDYFLIRRPGAFDGASGVFFLGSKSTTALSDRELIKQYRGLIPDKYH